MGAYFLEGGLLRLSTLSTGNGAASFNFNGGTLQAGDAFATNLPMTLGTSGGGATFDTNGYAVTLSGSFSGPGSLTKVDSGSLILGAANTYSGNTLITGGTLVLGSPLALQDSTLDTSGSGVLSFGTLTSATLGGLTGPGALTLSNTSSAALSLIVGNNNASTTFSGTLGGLGSLTKIGGGTLILAGSDSYAGGTIIELGTLEISMPEALPAGGSLAIGAGGTFVFDPTASASPMTAPSEISAMPVPESGTLVLLGVALGLVGYIRRRRRKARPMRSAASDQQDAPAILSFPSHSSSTTRHEGQLDRASSGQRAVGQLAWRGMG